MLMDDALTTGSRNVCEIEISFYYYENILYSDKEECDCSVYSFFLSLMLLLLILSLQLIYKIIWIAQAF